MNVARIKNIWYDLASKYTEDEIVINKLFSEIQRQYSDTSRYYHDLGHIQYMLDRLSEYNGEINDPDVLMFAIFYHDIIYIPQRNDNEKASADLASERLAELGLPPMRIVACHKQIMATEDHCPTADNDTNVLLDLDLASLGESEIIYKENSNKIRNEFKFVPGMIYRSKREKILRGLYKLDPIYKTKEFQNKFEKQARKNLKNDLD